jgi:Tfp pilus assembly PilM family ATPase
MKERDLPLGVDIGATRIRILQARLCAHGHGARVRSVAVRDVPVGAASSGSVKDTEYVAALIEDAVQELGTRERRCIASLGEPDAFLRSVRFPRMTAAERERSAIFEAQRHVDFPIEEALIRIHPVQAKTGMWALGIARKAALATRVAALHAAKLKPIAIDHESCALARALPQFDAIVDIGHQRTSLHFSTGQTPVTLQAFTGGADVTRGIVRELSVDEHTAEKRKRILGTAGAGDRARSLLSAEIASLIRSAREEREIRRIGLVGNAARLPGLAADLEGATGALCEMPVSEPLSGGDYPDDVVKSSAPDWNLAMGLALWEQP